MPRKIIPLVSGSVYHIYNRGVDKRAIFSDTEDYYRFYNSLNYFNDVDPVINFIESARKVKHLSATDSRDELVKIHSYCLLPNHFHIILTQQIDGGISEFMKRVGGGYTSYFNEKYIRSGSLFQGTYKRVSVDTNEKLLFLTTYVNFNHTVHALADVHDVYKTSKDIYLGTKSNSFISTDLILKQFNSHTDYERNALKLTKDIHNFRNKDKQRQEEERILLIE